MLQVENLSVNYGGIKALKSISLEVPAQKIVTLIGANGAGKSTTLRSITAEKFAITEKILPPSVPSRR